MICIDCAQNSESSGMATASDDKEGLVMTDDDDGHSLDHEREGAPFCMLRKNTVEFSVSCCNCQSTIISGLQKASTYDS